jgi:hypothetical protein
MDKKGQVFTLDLVVSMVLIFLCVGVAMRFFELKEIEMKEMNENMELERIGKTASQLMVSNPDISCELTEIVNGTTIGYLPNCLNKNQTITKQDLGIMEAGVPIQKQYNCYIEFKYGNSTTIPTGDCMNAPPAAPNSPLNIFSEKREIVLANDKKVPKDRYNNCTDDPSLGTACSVWMKGTATIKVWKNG